MFDPCEIKKPVCVEQTGLLIFNGGGTSTALGELIFHKTYLIDTIKLSIKKDVLTESFLNEKYVTEGLSSSEIARMTFSSRATVTSRLKLYGIPLKSSTRKTTGKMVFGYRQYDGRAIEAKKELEAIELIKFHRANGKSYARIADILKKGNVHTKKRTGIWHPKVVRQIYLRSGQCSNIKD